MTQTQVAKYNYSELRRRAESIADMRRERARKECKDAGLDPNLLGIHPHNAMVSFSYGKPWPNVDYSKVRKCLWILDRQFEGNAVLRRLYDRLGYEAFDWS